MDDIDETTTAQSRPDVVRDDRAEALRAEALRAAELGAARAKRDRDDSERAINREIWEGGPVYPDRSAT